MNPIGIWILTGYLGAGKTTMLNHLLESPELKGKKLALIINEFGKLGVDGSLLRPGDYAKFEINKGSIFCICTKTDFIKALDSIANEVKPDAVIIEATGIAETSDIESFVEDSPYADVFGIRANICLVDAENFTKVAPFMKAARGQVKWASGIVINKTDLVQDGDVEKLKAVLADINPDAPMIATDYGKIPYDFVAGLKHVRAKDRAATEPPKDIIAVSFETDKKVSRKIFEKVVSGLGEKILRLKGNVEFDYASRFVEVVYDRLMVKEPCENLKGKTAFTVIAWGIEKQPLVEKFEQAFET